MPRSAEVTCPECGERLTVESPVLGQFKDPDGEIPRAEPTSVTEGSRFVAAEFREGDPNDPDDQGSFVARCSNGHEIDVTDRI